MLTILNAKEANKLVDDFIKKSVSDIEASILNKAKKGFSRVMLTYSTKLINETALNKIKHVLSTFEYKVTIYKSNDEAEFHLLIEW